MNIFFIRHGEPDYVSDSLTNTGHKQAELLAQKLKKLKPDLVFQSSMGRAQQTATHSLVQWKMQAETFDWLRELSWGNLTGDAYATESPWVIKDEYIKNKGIYLAGDDWKKIPEVANDRMVSDIQERQKLFDEFLKLQGYERHENLFNAKNPNNKNIVFFCHGGITFALVAHLLNISFWQMISHTIVDLTSVSKISFSTEKGFCCPQIEYFNNTDHLKVL